LQSDHLQGAEYFDWKGIIIRQDESIHKVGTDAVLLGSWVPCIIPEANAILDVGTGTGVLALMMARCYPHAKVSAIDIDEGAIQLAHLNVLNAFDGSRVEVCVENILEKSSSQIRHDLVVCNPPYHPEKTLPSEDYKQRAKHLNVRVIDWVKGLCTRMTADGHLMLVIPFASAKMWIEAANALGFHNLDRLDVYSFEEDPEPKRTLLHLAGILAKPSINQMVIYQKDKTYTSSYLQFTGISPTNTRSK
jgi:tRNA1Val (adenine37-N6)-methyltransferase